MLQEKIQLTTEEKIYGNCIIPQMQVIPDCGRGGIKNIYIYFFINMTPTQTQAYKFNNKQT